MYRNFLCRCVAGRSVFRRATADGINNFSQAKAASVKVNADAPGSFYCGCQIRWQGKRRRRPSPAAIRCVKTRIAPDALSGSTLSPPAIRSSAPVLAGRRAKNCAKDPVYRKMESDMHNLQPAIGEVNGDRGNFMYSQWNGGEGQYGQCAAKVDFKAKLAEPPARARGAIARTYFYMRDQYQLKLSANKRSFLTSGISSTPLPHGSASAMRVSRRSR